MGLFKRNKPLALPANVNTLTDLTNGLLTLFAKLVRGEMTDEAASNYRKNVNNSLSVEVEQEDSPMDATQDTTEDAVETAKEPVVAEEETVENSVENVENSEVADSESIEEPIIDVKEDEVAETETIAEPTEEVEPVDGVEEATEETDDFDAFDGFAEGNEATFEDSTPTEEVSEETSVETTEDAVVADGDSEEPIVNDGVSEENEESTGAEMPVVDEVNSESVVAESAEDIKSEEDNGIADTMDIPEETIDVETDVENNTETSEETEILETVEIEPTESESAEDSEPITETENSTVAFLDDDSEDTEVVEDAIEEPIEEVATVEETQVADEDDFDDFDKHINEELQPVEDPKSTLTATVSDTTSEELLVPETEEPVDTIKPIKVAVSLGTPKKIDLGKPAVAVKSFPKDIWGDASVVETATVEAEKETSNEITTNNSIKSNLKGENTMTLSGFTKERQAEALSDYVNAGVNEEAPNLSSKSADELLGYLKKLGLLGAVNKLAEKDSDEISDDILEAASSLRKCTDDLTAEQAMVVTRFDTEGIDITQYVDHSYSAEKMRIIGEALKNGTDVLPLLNPAFTPVQLNTLLKLMKRGFCVDLVAKPEFSVGVMTSLCKGYALRIEMSEIVEYAEKLNAEDIENLIDIKFNYPDFDIGDLLIKVFGEVSSISANIRKVATWLKERDSNTTYSVSKNGCELIVTEPTETTDPFVAKFFSATVTTPEQVTAPNMDKK